MTTATVCPNSGPRERKRRLVGGLFFLAIAICVAASLLLFNAPRLWRLLVFLPTWASAIGFFQVSAKTCVALAARGLKNMDAGDEKITDPRELDQIRAQSRAVHIRSALTGLIAAALLVLLP
jgi:hypothetical protein